MAITYSDVFTLVNDGPTQQRVEVACLMTAYNVSNEDPGTANHVGRLAWAKATLSDPVTAANHAVHFVLAGVFAANQSVASLAAFQALLTDAAIQSYTDASLTIFAS